MMHLAETLQSHTKEDGGIGAVLGLISMHYTHPAPVVDALHGTVAAAGPTTPVWR